MKEEQNSYARSKEQIQLGLWYTLYLTLLALAIFGRIMFFANFNTISVLALSTFVEIGVLAALLFGLSTKKKWGIKLNKIVLVYIMLFPLLLALSTFIYTNHAGIIFGRIISALLFTPILYLIWVRPNWQYFKKREHLFK